MRMTKERVRSKTVPQKKQGRTRVAFLFMALAVFGILICGRLFYLQVVRGAYYAELDLGQAEEVRPLQSPRGTIYDRNGKVLAVSAVTLSLYADPQELNRDPQVLAQTLAPLLSVPEAKLAEKLAQTNRFVWLERMLDKEVSDQVKALIGQQKITGLHFVEESKRYYPNGNLLAQVLGFVGIDDKGLDGIEMVLDQEIKGDSKQQTIITSRYGTPILKSTLSQLFPDEERSVYLTIDAQIQFFAERALDRAMGTTRAAGGSIIVMDPRTGEILAMANRPTYNPNRFAEGTEEDFRNRAVTDLYEPGSTFKPIIAAAALASGSITPETVLHDTGSVYASGHTIQNWNSEGYGDVRLVDIIKYSINTGFAMVGLRTGGAVLTDYAKRFGFGQPTGIELPGEGEGILFNPDDMRDSDIATMSIGQSIAVTPLQMLQAYGALANGGKMMKPHVIASIVNPDGTTYQASQAEEVGQPITPEVDHTLVPMLEQVVSGGGGVKAQVNGYRLAGKTGTAQKLDTERGGYLEGRYIASFIGFGPIEQPEAVCLVVLDDPEGVYYGGQIAAPVFAEVMGEIMRYRGIHPNVTDVADTGTAEKAALEPLTLTRTEEGKIIVPDFTGRRLRDVLEWANQAQVGVVPEGEGVVITQTPLAGLTLEDTRQIRVQLAE